MELVTPFELVDVGHSLIVDHQPAIRYILINPDPPRDSKQSSAHDLLVFPRQIHQRLDERVLFRHGDHLVGLLKRGVLPSNHGSLCLCGLGLEDLVKVLLTELLVSLRPFKVGVEIVSHQKRLLGLVHPPPLQLRQLLCLALAPALVLRAAHVLPVGLGGVVVIPRQFHRFHLPSVGC